MNVKTEYEYEKKRSGGAAGWKRRLLHICLPLLAAAGLYIAWLLNMPQDLDPFSASAAAYYPQDSATPAPTLLFEVDVTPSANPLPAPTLSPTPTPTPEPTPTPLPTFTPHPDPDVTITPLHRLEQDAYTIDIRMMEDGHNTWYVTHAWMWDTSRLKTAFAEDKFGKNIRETTTEIARRNNAVFAVNGDYYGYRDDGIIIRGGQLYRDNPNWRDLFVIYADGRAEAMPSRDANPEELLAGGVVDSFSFGPTLIQDYAILEDLNSRTLGGTNPRTGIGAAEPGHFVFITVDGRKRGYSEGIRLEAFAELFAAEGCRVAYNLDGGGSATMCYMGELVNKPQGTQRERNISDIIYIS